MKKKFICHENGTSHTRDHILSIKGNQSYLSTTLNALSFAKSGLDFVFYPFYSYFYAKILRFFVIQKKFIRWGKGGTNKKL